MDYKDFWISVLRRLQPTIKKAPFITWFQNTVILDKKDGKVIIGVPSPFAQNWLANKFNLKILQAVQEIDSEIKSVEYKVDTNLTFNSDSRVVDIKELFSEQYVKKVRKVRKINEVNVQRGFGTEKITSEMLNNKYSLNNFIVGKDNRLPHAACSAVANTPGGIYNPLYIYGSVGLGKTHLLQAIGNSILRNKEDFIIKYITAERFVSEVVDAIGKRYMSSFKDRYRKIDCLLIDDIQFFSRKNSSQQEFFHTFNELYNANKQIVLTSDRPPVDLEDLDERLKSRFGMGMVVELLFPDYETRLAILQQKCQEFQMLVDPEVLDFIAQNVHHNVRELEGVLRQILAETELCDGVPTVKSVAQIIKRLNKANEIIGLDVYKKANVKKVKDAKEILNIVAAYYNVSITDLVGKARQREIMIPRQICMYLIKNELGYSYEKIGLEFGGRNHTTVMHACSKTAQQLKKNLRLVQDINSIKMDMGM